MDPRWKLWEAWDVQVLVLFSLTLQIILFALGGRKRYTRGTWISIIVWSSYLILTLGKLSDITYGHRNSRATGPTNELRALWAALLLLHLGGPDTMTAYSVEDRHLWMRHFLGLVVQAIVAVYIILRCWTNSWHSILSLLLFLAGIIKYVGRTWVLQHAVRKRRSIWFWLPDFEARLLTEDKPPDFEARLLTEDKPRLELLTQAYLRSDILKPHIPGWAEISRLRYASLLSMDKYSLTEVINIIEYELELMYYALYTKAPIIYSTGSLILRSIIFFITEFALWAFIFVVKPANTNEDVLLTYVLLVVAVVLDVYAVVLILYSDRGINWMMKSHKKSLATQILQVVTPHSLRKSRRWSNSVGQFNLLSFCLNNIVEPSKFRHPILDFSNMEKTCLSETNVDIPGDLIELIVKLMREMDGQRGSWPFSKRGEWALGRHGSLQSLSWSVRKQVDESIILWHLATDICYYCDDTKSRPREMSKLISDYMIYLLVKHSDMLCVVTGQEVKTFSYPFIYAAAVDIVRIFERQNPLIADRKEACRILLREELHSYHAWDASKEAQKLAKFFMDSSEDKWTVISGVWVEMLCYASSHCQLNYHVQQRLAQGGELLTFVWLLLFHLKFDCS